MIPRQYNPLPGPDLGPTSLDEVLITEQLSLRPAREPDYKAQSQALTDLISRLYQEDPLAVLKRLVRVTLQLSPAATTAGISLVEERDNELVFYWPAAEGLLGDQLAGTIPRAMSPCGVVLDRNSPQLFRSPQRYYASLKDLHPPIVENLLLPFQVAGQLAGTLWLISSDPQQQFDDEDRRLLTSLSSVAAVCYELRLAHEQANRSLKAERQAKHSMRDANQTLEHRVAERTRALTRQAGRLRELNNQLAEAEQRERQRLARVLHDHLQQLLVAAQMRGQMAIRTADTTKREHNVSELVSMLGEAIEVTRSLSLELDPPVLHKGGLGPALAWLGERMQQLHGLKIHVEAGPSARHELPRPVSAFLFQAVRELLLNVVKHAHAEHAWVRLNGDNHTLHVSVEDDGAGCDLDQPPTNANGGFGLASIRQRIEFWNGDLQTGRSKSGGCRVELTLPINPDGGSEMGVAAPAAHEM